MAEDFVLPTNHEMPEPTSSFSDSDVQGDVDVSLDIDRMMTRDDCRKLLSSSPTAKICICGVPVACVLDTGAETSLISSKFYHDHLTSKVGALSEVGTYINLKGANGLSIPVEGFLEVPIEVLGHEFTASFLVSRPQPDSGGRREKYPILLGCNILRMLSCRLKGHSARQLGPDWDLALRWFRSIDSSRDPVTDVIPDSQCAEVWTHKYESVPPACAKLIHCKMGSYGSEFKGKTVHLRPLPPDTSEEVDLEDHAVSSWPVVEGIQEVKGASIPVLVANVSPQPLIIPALTKLANAFPAEIKDQVVASTDEDGVVVSTHCVVVDTTDEAQASHNLAAEESSQNDHQRESFTFPDKSSYLLPPGISLRGMDSDAAHAVASLIREHEGAFAMGPYDLGFCDLIPHEIKLADDKPVNLPYRRIIPSRMTEVKAMLQDLLDRDVIRRSVSPYASPIVLVKKKNGQLRLCIDYRRINEKTVKDSFPLPRIEETLESLDGAKLFSSLDLAHGYFQVAVHPGFSC